MSAQPSGFPPFAPPLPPGWTEHQAPGGQSYYHHAASGQSTYTRPLPNIPFPIPGGMPFVTSGAIIPGAPKEKKKKEKPLVKTPVPGTPWLRVKTTEGNIFWTHKERKESVWEVPEEIKEAVEALERVEKEKEEEERQDKIAKEHEERERQKQERETQEREEVERIKQELEGSMAGKRKATESVEPDTNAKKQRITDEGQEEEQDEEWQRAMADEMVADIAAETTHAKEKTPQNDPISDSPRDSGPGFKVPDRVDLSVEEAKALFKTLLQEKNINPLHPWDVSLPLFISDPRYVLLHSVAARREAFDEYCRDAARAQRAAKAAALKAESGTIGDGEKDKDKEAYSRLLKDEVTSTRTTWHDFRRKWKKDRRFFGWAGDREREKAFRDWIRDLAEVKKRQAEKAEREFYQLLREHKEIKPGDVWKEVKRNIDPKESRYDAVGSSSLREELFGTYIKTLGTTSGDKRTRNDQDEEAGDLKDEDTEALRRKQRAEKAERGLREREEKVRRERAGLERELGRTRGAVGREEGEREFMTLLTDAVRDPQATWDRTAPSLSHDPRFVLCALPHAVQQDIFSKHIARLRNKYLTGLYALFLAHAPRLNIRWGDLDASAQKAIRGSVPVVKLGLSDTPEEGEERRVENVLESEFEKWQRERNTEARKTFDEMLGENAFLEFWGRMSKAEGEGLGDATVPDEEDEEGEEGGGKADLKMLARGIDTDEVGKVLRNDARWTAFDHVPEKRETWLRDYMERLSAPKLSVHIADKS